MCWCINSPSIRKSDPSSCASSQNAMLLQYPVPEHPKSVLRMEDLSCCQPLQPSSSPFSLLTWQSRQRLHTRRQSALPLRKDPELHERNEKEQSHDHPWAGQKEVRRRGYLHIRAGRRCVVISSIVRHLLLGNRLELRHGCSSRGVQQQFEERTGNAPVLTVLVRMDQRKAGGLTLGAEHEKARKDSGRKMRR